MWQETSEGSTALPTARPKLGSIDEHEGEALRDWRVRHPRHWITYVGAVACLTAFLSPRCCGGPQTGCVGVLLVSWIHHVLEEVLRPVQESDGLCA